MWTTLSVSRWISLLTLAVVMLSLATEVDSENLGLGCCIKVSSPKINEDVKKCYKQGKEDGCEIEAYRIITVTGREYCVTPAHPKLKKFLAEGKECPSITSKKRRLEVLKDMD